MAVKRDALFLLVVLISVFVVLRDFLSPGYPPSWGGDSYGHLFKISLLMKGYRPWIEAWYGGYPFLWFYPPLAYYLGALLGIPFNSAVAGYKLSAMFAMLLGAISMRVLLKELGFSDITAYSTSIAYVFAPYHLRILAPEGNFPRFLGINLAPLLILALLYVWKGDRAKALIAGVLASLVLLSHHTLVVTFGTLALFLIPYLFAVHTPNLRKIGFNVLISGLTVLLLSSFWIVPFAMDKSQAHFLKENSIEYLFRIQSARLSDITLPSGTGWALYQGMLLYLGMVGAIIGIVYYKGSRKKRLLGMGTMLGITAAIVLSLGYYGPCPRLNQLPLLDMIPPYRWLDPVEFFSAIGFAILLEFVVTRTTSSGDGLRKGLAVLVLVLVALSLSDVHLRTNYLQSEQFPSDYLAVLNYIANDNGTGWRYLQWGMWSTQGSRIAYTPALTGKPILGGWYRQGDPAYPQHTYLNYAISHDPEYSKKALKMYSVKYVIVDANFNEASEGVKTLEGIGFEEVYSAGSLRLYSWKNWSFVEPGANVLVIGSWPFDLGVGYDKGEFIDDYVGVLEEYRVVILNGYKYRDPLVWRKLEDYVKQGGILFVNTFRSPDAVAVRLGVASTIVRIDGKANLSSDIYNVSAFSNFTYDGSPWTATAYKGNITPLIKLGNLTVLGFRDIGRGRVYFIGLNLPYHAVYTKNQYEMHLLRQLIGTYIDEPAIKYKLIKWEDGKIVIWYEANSSVRVIISENYYPYWNAYVDGNPLTVDKNEEFGLIQLSLPAGTHELTLEFKDPYLPLKYLSLAGWVILPMALLAEWHRRKRKISR